jgi:hypothetical protein
MDAKQEAEEEEVNAEEEEEESDCAKVLMSSEAADDCCADDDAQVLLAADMVSCGVKEKQEEDEGAYSPVPSYTLQAAQDQGSRRSSVNGSCDEASRVSSRRCSSADGSGSSRASSSSGSSGSSRWSEEGSECSEAGGLGGLFRGLFGCCVAPASFSDDADDDSAYDESEESEECGDDWEACSQSSDDGKASKVQQQWATKAQKA